MRTNEEFDVIIVGGSYSGLSAAMALGRALRRVLVIDSQLPCNRQTPYSHNFITQDGERPSVIADKAKEQVLKYDTVKFYNDIALSANKFNNGFHVVTQNGRLFIAKKLIFACGVNDIMPDISGFSECWGISVIHCPYCHGYEVKNERTGILANGDPALHYAKLLRNLTNDLIILTNGRADFTVSQREKLYKNNIEIVEKEIDYLRQEAGRVRQVVFKDKSTLDLKVIYSRPAFEQHCKIPSKLGCELTEHGLIKVDLFQKTTVNDIFACGDSTCSMRSVANAVATGNIAGAITNNEFAAEEF